MSAFSTSKLTVALRGAAALSLACTIVGLFVARARVIEASDWVRHTSEVEVRIAACQLDLRDAQLEHRPSPEAPARRRRAGARTDRR